MAAIVFFVMRAIPGDPILNWLGSSYEKADYDRLRAQYGLDLPLVQQFFIWFGHLFQGDLGYSVLTQLSVMAELLRRIPVTVELIVLALLVALPVGLGAGIWAAWRYGRPDDHALLTATLWPVTCERRLAVICRKVSPPTIRSTSRRSRSSKKPTSVRNF